MKAQLFAFFAVLARADHINNIFARQNASNNQGYLDSVCSPNVTESSGELPPCISVINIQGQCAPNNTQSLGYLAMAECLCNPPSTFFADWLGCRECLEYHGGLSERDLARYSIVISSVSNAICTGTPTAQFAGYFTSIDQAVAAPSSGATTSSDQAPSQTAVSLYYTASGAQGPGAITGSATGATRSVGPTTVLSGTRTGSGGSTTAGSTQSAASGSSGSSSTSTSSTGAAATAAYGFGLAIAAAGGVLML